MANTVTDQVAHATTEVCPQCSDEHAAGIIAAYASSSTRRPGTTCPECPAPKGAARVRPSEVRAAAVKQHPKARPITVATRKMAGRLVVSTETAEEIAAKARRMGADATVVTRGSDRRSVGRRADVLAPGALQERVLAYLRRHRDSDHSPQQVAKAIDRSSGAVANALERFAEQGKAERTSTAPKRYRAS